jgi:preprotein translocase subunit SecA
MPTHPNQLGPRQLNNASGDEVHTTLVDEARTPLIISGQAEKSNALYFTFAGIIPRLEKETDYTVDEKAHSVSITESGVAKVEKALGVENLYDDVNIELTHHMNQALKAHALMRRDRDYVVKDGQVIIVDEFTGRLMFGRRYSDGLHQSIEAKERVKVERESQTLATITFQNYFRMYDKLAGMTGTASTEEQEFKKIYKLDVVVIPTNQPMVRKDLPDVIYKTEQGKFRAVVEQIAERHRAGQPVLVGTISIEKSEVLSSLLKKRGVTHQVLNAKHHDKEAEIVAQAGRQGAVTIATNMAGRGTDILLGGNPEFLARQDLRRQGCDADLLAGSTPSDPGAPVSVTTTNGSSALAPGQDPAAVHRLYEELVEKYQRDTEEEHQRVVEAGGLHIIGTERHESRRIDNQLRGRSGRQGDPGSSQFFSSLEDDLMRLFGSDNITGLMERLGMEEDMPIEHGMITKSIETAQKRVENRNFDLRKHVLQYDDVMNQQRELIYRQRRQVLTGENIRDSVMEMIDTAVDRAVTAYAPEGVHEEEWDLQALLEHAEQLFLPAHSLTPDDLEGMGRGQLKEFLAEQSKEAYAAREQTLGDETMRELERMVMLRIVDDKWMDHLDAMDQLREGIGLRAYGQKDPLVEYKFEGYEMFQNMIDAIQDDVVRYMFRVNVVKQEDPKDRRLTENRYAEETSKQPVRREQKVGRNDPCPCGSGKKYKKCCAKTENK